MSLFREIERIKTQIIDTERLLELVREHPYMSYGYKAKLIELRKQLEELPKESFEPKIVLLFSGEAVQGSQGIKSTFISKTLSPFQGMIKTQTALVRFGRVGKRGQAKRGKATELYLTALPTGSFGVELSQLESNDLLEPQDVADAMKQVMILIKNTSIDDPTFERAIENTPRRNLNNLKKFLSEISEEKSIVRMECNELEIEISPEKVQEAYHRVSETIDEENEFIIKGIFRGILLDSGKIEFQDEVGQKRSGFINEDLTEDELIKFDQDFLNKECRLHFQLHTTKFATGNEKIDYELLGISELPN